MGKTVKKILVGLAIIVSAGLLIPVAIGIGGLTLGYALVAVQILGVSTIINAFVPEVEGGAGSRLLAENLSIFSSPTVVRGVVFGRSGIAGQILFRENIKNTGDTPDELLIILGLAGYPVTSLEKFWLNGELVFDGDSTTGPGAITTGKFANELVVDFRTGEETSAAFSGIAALSTGWNAKTRILRGIPSLGIRLKITKKVDGKFQPLAQIKGSKLYDPRLDSTIPGGSGAHRFADPTTWAFSVNPKLAELLYLRGADVASTRIFGMGKAVAAIDLENFASEANICEEQINVVGGGTIDRYTCNGLLIPGANHKLNLQRLLSASAGTMDASGGVYRTFAGSWRASSMTLTETDIDGAPTEMQLQIDQSKEVNVIEGSFAEPTEMWVVKEYPQLTDAASITLFGENSKKLDLPFTTDHRIAQRISKIQMKRLNAKRAFNANYWLRAASLQPGDIVTQTYSRYRITAETFRVDFWSLEASEDKQSNRRLVVPMRLVEELQSWFDWDEATEEKSINAGGLLSSVSPLDTTDSDFSFVGIGEQIELSSAEDGANFRPLARGVLVAEARDGDAITFSPAWSNVPTVRFMTGGVSFSDALTGKQHLDHNALNLSGSGFTASLKVKELTGAITNRTDSTVSTPSVPSGLDHSINKGQTLEAHDDKYTFQYDVSLFDPPSEPPEPISVGLYTNDGAGYVLRRTVFHSSDVNDHREAIVVDGLGLNDDFGLNKESGIGGSTVFDQVEYGTATAPTTESATPTGSSSVQYKILGG